MRFLTIGVFGSMLAAVLATLLVFTCGLQYQEFDLGPEDWGVGTLMSFWMWMLFVPILLGFIPFVIAGYVRMWRPRLR